MPVVREKVVIAMSGGVDSSVAAGLLVEQGYDVIGLFMRVGVEGAADGGSGGPAPPAMTAQGGPARVRQGCCSASDAADARYVAGMFGIPFYALNFREDFGRIVDYFSDEYAKGRTPNPCVVCNTRLKFGELVEYADAVGARYIATGHYARIGRPTGEHVLVDSTGPSAGGAAKSKGPLLMRAVDARKDQSYVLFGIARSLLDRIMFPVGSYTKQQVRALADGFGLPNSNKPDSVEICFVPDRDYARVVRERRPGAFVWGEIVNATGQVIGRHKGIANYTIGQRRGLGVAAGRPLYVTRLNVLNNTVTLGDECDLMSFGLIASDVNCLVDLPSGSFRADVKIRYLHTPVPASVQCLSGGRARVVFDEPQRAVTPGQAVVFYDGDAVLGGGWISHRTDPLHENLNDAEVNRPTIPADSACPRGS